MHPPGLCNNLVLMSTSRTFEPRKLNLSCTCRMILFDSSTTSYPPRYRQIRPFARPGCLLRANGWGSWVDPARPRPSPEKTAVLCRQIRGWRTPARRRGIHHRRPRFGCGPSQVDDDPFERRQGQIPTRQAEHLTSLRYPSELSNDRHERRASLNGQLAGPPWPLSPVPASPRKLAP